MLAGSVARACSLGEGKKASRRSAGAEARCVERSYFFHRPQNWTKKRAKAANSKLSNGLCKYQMYVPIDHTCVFPSRTSVLPKGAVSTTYKIVVYNVKRSSIHVFTVVRSTSEPAPCHGNARRTPKNRGATRPTLYGTKKPLFPGTF